VGVSVSVRAHLRIGIARQTDPRRGAMLHARGSLRWIGAAHSSG